MTTLVRTRTVLTRVDWLGSRVYRAVDEETGAVTRSLHIDDAAFAELGEPDTITISIEAGDTLNGTPPPYCQACA